MHGTLWSYLINHSNLISLALLCVKDNKRNINVMIALEGKNLKKQNNTAAFKHNWPGRTKNSYLILYSQNTNGFLLHFFSLWRLVRLEIASKWVNNTSDLALLTSWAGPGLGMPLLALCWKALCLFCKSRASFLTDLGVKVPEGRWAEQGSIVHKEAEPPTQWFPT